MRLSVSIYLFISFVFCVSSAYEYGHYVEEGSFCRKRTGEKGVCTHFSYCQSAIDEVRRNGRPEICSFVGIFPIVCCQTDASQHVYQANSRIPDIKDDNDYYFKSFDENNLSLRKCKKYHSPSVQNNLVYNTITPKIQQYPHLALVGFQARNKLQWLCTGALISEKFILAAASCLLKEREIPNYIRLGETDSDSYNNYETSQNFGVERFHIHPEYDDKHNNIALIELDKQARITSYVKPACLAITKELNGTIPECVSWKMDRSKQSLNLKHNYYKYTSNKYCTSSDEDPYVFRDDKDHKDICAKVVSDQKENYSELSGPLQITNFFYKFNNFPEIVGVPSFKGEGKGFNGFTKVYPFVPWIENIVWSEHRLK